MKKTLHQLRAIYGLVKKRGLDRDELSAVMTDAGIGTRISELSFDAANILIRRLGGQPFTRPRRTPRRTVNYRKQRDGIVTLASPKALELMDSLAEGRGMSREGLERMCRRMFGSPRPRTAQACSAVIEALKSMNRRDRQRAQNEPKEAA
jgi:hypothetical protein